MTVRPGTPADAAAIAALQTRTWWSAYGDRVDPGVLAEAAEGREALWDEILARDRRTVVAEQDGAIVGFASWGESRDEDGEGDGELYAIYVAPEAQGAGVGTTLHDLVLDRLRALGFVAATLWTLAANAQARSFYEHAGWAAEPETEQMGSWGAPKIRYRRAL